MKSNTSHSIGIFDSGVGGLSVMNAIQTLLPYENLVYLADELHFPYGDKSNQQILEYSLANVQFLMRNRIKSLVVACGTATTVALPQLQSLFSIPMIGIIEPSFNEALLLSPKKIGILATQTTIDFQPYIGKQSLCLSCPSLVDLIEKGALSSLKIHQLLERFLAQLKNHIIDVLILGCTHFNLIEKHIRSYIHPKIRLINSAKACAFSLSQLLQNQQLLNSSSYESTPTIISNRDSTNFQKKADRLIQFQTVSK